MPCTSFHVNEHDSSEPIHGDPWFQKRFRRDGLGETLSTSIFHGFVSLRVLNKNTIRKQHLMYLNKNSVFISDNLYLKMKENTNWKTFLYSKIFDI